MFLLPARIPHSPQRQANTVGLVVERKRLRSETDCLRYYVDNSTDILFERWFYCENLGTQLVPVIQEFMASKQHKTGKPDPDKWIKDNEASFLPPVCNKLMFFYQLNIMYVGGPNIRKDYHIEEGEELFYQIRGDMVLKVIENGKHKDVHIREGEMFLLPARIPHSPQRQANTVGLVVERKRLRSETDCLRYYVDNSTDILFERWFYCENLGTQLVPVIQEFMASKQHKTGKPDPADPIKPPPYPLNTMNVMTPFSFKDWVEKQKPALVSGRPLDMFGNQFETEVMLYGPGESETSKRTSDGWIWQLEGSSSVSMNGQDYNLSVGDCLLVLGLTEYHWQRAEDCVALYVVQNPERKRPF